MNDMDMIKNALNEPERPLEHVTLEQIIGEVPNMALDCPATYALYLHYNPHLEKDEVADIERLIERLRTQRTRANDRNIEYLTRHERGEKDEPNDGLKDVIEREI